MHATKITGKGAVVLNKAVKKKMTDMFPKIVEAVKNRAKEYAGGLTMPSIIGGMNNKIGISESGYIPSGELAGQIFATHSEPHGLFWKSTVSSLSKHSSWVEFGTGLYGPEHKIIEYDKVDHKKPINETHTFSFPYQGGKKVVSSILGQHPKPFMRAAKWWFMDHYKNILKDIDRAEVPEKTAEVK